MPGRVSTLCAIWRTTMAATPGTEMKKTLSLTGLTINAMALIAPGAFLWTTFQAQVVQQNAGSTTAHDMVSGLRSEDPVPDGVDHQRHGADRPRRLPVDHVPGSGGPTERGQHHGSRHGVWVAIGRPCP